MKAKVCVDYLSYDWRPSEIILAYKEVHSQQSKLSFKQKTTSKGLSKAEKIKLLNEQTNLIRYQNAIWRQMSIKCTNQQENTKVDPSIIDWQKECDITWLYGPLYLSHEQKLQASKVQASSSISSTTTTSNNNKEPCILLKPVLKTYNTSPSQLFRSSMPYDSRSEPGKSSCVRFHPEISELKYKPELPPTSPGIKSIIREEQQEEEKVLMTQSVTSAIKVILLDRIDMMRSQSISLRVCASILCFSAWIIYISVLRLKIKFWKD